MMHGPGTRYAIYARYSTDQQKPTSIEDQIALCRAYGDARGWVLVQTYADAALQGSFITTRQQINAMVMDAEQKLFDVVLAETANRFSRSQTDLPYLFENLGFFDVAMYTRQDGMLSSLHIAMKGWEGANAIKTMGDQSRRGQMGAVQRGLIAGSNAYGYRLVRTTEHPSGKREIVEAERVIVVRIFKEYQAGVSPHAICAGLNRDGIPSPKGAKWVPSTLIGSPKRRIGLLRNELYRGVQVWGKTVWKRKPGTGTKHSEPALESNLVRVDLPEYQIIDDETFFDVQRQLEERQNGALHSSRRPTHLFSGRVFCGACGEGYVVTDGRTCGCSGRILMGICSNRRRVPREDIESAVLDNLHLQLLHPELIQPFTDEYADARVEREAAAQREAQLSRESIPKLDQEIARILAAIKDGAGGGAAGLILNEELEKLARRKQAATQAVSRAPKRAGAVLDAPSVAQRLRRELTSLQGQLGSDRPEAVRARDIIRSFVDRIVVTPIPVEQEDGRGCGPVMLTVEGRLTELLRVVEPEFGRVTLSNGRTANPQDHANPRFTFGVYLSNQYRHKAWGVYADQPGFEAALNSTAGPVRIVDVAEQIAALVIRR